MSDLNEYLEYAIMLAKGAGDILMEYFRGNHLDIRTKLNNSDVVTAADKASEKYIISSIHDRFPDHGIMAEESGEENSERVWRWVIDPLDGTTNFSQGLPVFCVSIALEYEGNPVVGVIYAPYLGELFHAIKGFL
ncbi:MAG: inositol monophosphatase, partial [Muribaculaceae bacterium]|nr:inositol monophosphatase [Muribaculaceae bacterium]